MANATQLMQMHRVLTRDSTKESLDITFAIDVAAATRKKSKESTLAVDLKNIHKTYLIGLEGIPVLRGVNLEIHQHEWIIIYGTSGGGKTSLLNIMGTIDKPTRGEVLIGNTKINSKTSDKELSRLRRTEIGFVFQSFNLLPNMTAKQNVQVPMMLQGLKQVEEKSILSLEKVGLSHRVNHYPKQLSGGEQQRIAIARSIAHNPKILFLDEPTGDLDSRNTQSVMSLLQQLNREGMTLIMVTHDVYLKNFAHRVIYMRDGKLEKIETIKEELRVGAMNELLKHSVSANKEEEKTSIRYPRDYPMLLSEQPMSPK